MRDAYVAVNGFWTRWGRPSLAMVGGGSTVAPTFTLGTTKPSAALTGVGSLVETDGTIRDAPWIIINDDVYLTGGQTLADRIVKGRVYSSGTGNIIENCDIRGAVTAPTAYAYLIKTSGSTGTLIRHCTLRPQTHSFYWNGIGQKNYTAYRCDISGVIDGFSAFSTASDRLCKINVGGCYGHDLIQFRPDRANTPSNPRFETHGEFIQLESNVQDPADIVVEGNYFNARHQYAVDAYTGEIIASTNSNRSCIMLSPIANGETGYTCSGTFRKNWFYGGFMTFNAGGNNPGGRVIVTDNRFERPTETATSGGPGVYASLVIDAGLVKVDVSGNTYDDAQGGSVPVKSW